MKCLPLFIGLFVLFFNVSTSSAQHIYTLNIENTEDSMMILGYYRGANSYVVDTAYRQGKTFVFSVEKEMDPGIYFFTNLGKVFCEFLVDGEEDNIVFSTEKEDMVRAMTIKGSPTNSTYYNYLKGNLEVEEGYKALMSQKESMPKEELRQRQDSLRRSSDANKEAFIAEYPNHLLTKILQATMEIQVPELPMPKNEEGNNDTLAWRQNSFNYYLWHYFDNIDFACGGLIRTPEPVFHKRFSRYWDEMIQYQPTDSVLKLVVHWVEKSRANKLMFQFFVHQVTEHFLQSPVMGHDAIYVYMIKHYYATGETWWMSPSGIESEVERATKWEHSLIGTQIPELTCPDTNGIYRNLYNVQKEYVILVSWSPDCGHCKKDIPALHKLYLAQKDSLNFEVFAMNSGDNIEEWKRFVKEHKLSWINVNGMVANFNWKRYFDITSTPYTLILDKNKRIIAKQPQVDFIEEILKAHKDGTLKL